MTHFIALAEEPYDRTEIYGIFDTFEAARDNMELRTAQLKAPESDGEDEYGDMGADRATIQEWGGPQYARSWERNPLKPIEWIEKTWR